MLGMHAQRMSVGDDPVKLVPAASIHGSAALLKNLGEDEIDIGGGDVASGAGFPFAAGQILPVDVTGGHELWAVAAADTSVDVAVIIQPRAT